MSRVGHGKVIKGTFHYLFFHLHLSSPTDVVEESVVLAVDLEVLQVHLAGVVVVLLPNLAQVDDVKLCRRRHGVLELRDGQGQLADDVVARHVVVIKDLHLDLPVEVAGTQFRRSKSSIALREHDVKL